VVNKIIKRLSRRETEGPLCCRCSISRQAEFEGWLSVPVMDYVASILKIPPIEVYEVASFYSMYNLNPVGKCLIEVVSDRGHAGCGGSDDIIAHISKKLGIQVGETTADGMFHIEDCRMLWAHVERRPMLQCGRGVP